MTWILAALTGLILGLVGAGGAILTVPLLVYGFGVPPGLATGSAFVIVGLLSLTGAVESKRRNEVDVQTVLLFAPISIVVAMASRFLVHRYLPPEWNGLRMESLLMTGFAVLMLAAAASIFRKATDQPPSQDRGKIIRSATIVGIASGVFGAGGGFLIIPALVTGLGMTMPLALGTSLAIIALNSAAGLSLDMALGKSYPWVIIAQVAVIAFIGMRLGTLARTKMDGGQLKQAFAVVVVLTALFIVVREWM